MRKTIYFLILTLMMSLHVCAQTARFSFHNGSHDKVTGYESASGKHILEDFKINKNTPDYGDIPDL